MKFCVTILIQFEWAIDWYFHELLIVNWINIWLIQYMNYSLKPSLKECLHLINLIDVVKFGLELSWVNLVADYPSWWRLKSVSLSSLKGGPISKIVTSSSWAFHSSLDIVNSAKIIIWTQSWMVIRHQIYPWQFKPKFNNINQIDQMQTFFQARFQWIIHILYPALQWWSTNWFHSSSRCYLTDKFVLCFWLILLYLIINAMTILQPNRKQYSFSLSVFIQIFIKLWSNHLASVVVLMKKSLSVHCS
jgi:hypothetical protein